MTVPRMGLSAILLAATLGGCGNFGRVETRDPASATTVPTSSTAPTTGTSVTSTTVRPTTTTTRPRVTTTVRPTTATTRVHCVIGRIPPCSDQLF